MGFSSPGMSQLGSCNDWIIFLSVLGRFSSLLTKKSRLLDLMKVIWKAIREMEMSFLLAGLMTATLSTKANVAEVGIIQTTKSAFKKWLLCFQQSHISSLMQELNKGRKIGRQPLMEQSGSEKFPGSGLLQKHVSVSTLKVPSAAHVFGHSTNFCWRQSRSFKFYLCCIIWAPHTIDHMTFGTNWSL